jgi:PST family polysaccharide transporter
MSSHVEQLGTSAAAPGAGDPAERYLRTDNLKADLGARAARGGAVTVVTQGSKFVLSLGATAVLARLLTPQDYGLVGMVAIVTGFVALFKDLGLSTATVQHAELNQRQVSALFWLNVALSAAVMLFTAALSPAVAWFFGDPRLMTITLVSTLGFLFGGLTVQHEALLRRQMRFGALSAVAFVALVCNIAVSVALAAAGAGYWALIGGQLALGCATMCGVWVACGWRPGSPSAYGEVRTLVAFGRDLTGFGVINYFARNLDNLLIGRVWGAQQLGFYAKSYQLLLLPLDQINEPITAVAVPALSRLHDDPERYRKAYLRLLEKVALLTMPGVTGLFQPIANTTGWLLITQGRSRDMLRWGFMGGTLAVAAICAGLPWGAVGVAAAYAGVRVLVADPLLYWYVGRSGPVRARDIYRAVAPIAFAALCGLGAALVFRQRVEIRSPLAGLAAVGVVLALGFLLVLAALPAGRAALRDVGGLLKLLRRGKGGPQAEL